MSNMKQAVYAGAVGALVAMQGCGEGDASKQEVVVGDDGTTTLQQSLDDVVKTAQAELEDFDTSQAWTKVQEVVKQYNIDTNVVERELGDLSKMDVHQMSRIIHKKFQRMLKSEEMAEIKDSLAKVFEVISHSQTLSKEAAIKEINDICIMPVIDETHALTLVDALETMYNTTADNEYCADVDKALAKCAPGISVKSLPCFSTQYETVSVAAIKKKQNLDQPQEKEAEKEAEKEGGVQEEAKEAAEENAKEGVKAVKKPAVKKPAQKTKSIYDVMPTNLSSVENPPLVFEHIREQIKLASGVDRRELMVLAKAIKNLNLTLKKPVKPAKPVTAVKNGQKVEAKAEDPAAEKPEDPAAEQPQTTAQAA